MKKLLICLCSVLVLISILFATPKGTHAAFPTDFWQTYSPSASNSTDSAADQTPDDPETGPLVAVTRVVPPFVIDTTNDPQKLCVGSVTLPGKSNKAFCGYSQELLQIIAQKMGREVAPQALDHTADDIVADLSGPSPKYNMAIGNMSVTSAREEVIDFSIPLPITNSGIQIMTGVPEAQRPNLLSTMGSIALQIYPVVGVILLLMLATAAIVYWIERRQKGSFLRTDSWVKGIAEAFWWILTMIFGQEEAHPRRVTSRVIAFLWMPFGVISISLFTAAVTANLTAQQIRTTITGVDDLRDKKVLTVAGSTSKLYLEEQGIKPTLVSTISDAYPKLESGDYDAIVYDAPALQYYADHEGKSKVMTVGKLLKRESYAIAFPTGSPLREQVNQIILQLQDDGTIERLNYKWFEKQ